MKIVCNLVILIALHFLNISIRTSDNVQLSSFKSCDTLIIKEYEYQRVHIPNKQYDAMIYDYDTITYNSLVSFIKAYEGYSDSAYIGLAGEPLIAYGHLISKEEYIYDTTNHIKISQAKGDSILYKDIRLAIEYTYHFTGLKGNKLLALSALVYNAGIGSVCKSGLISSLNKCKKQTIIKDIWLSSAHHRTINKNGEYVRDYKGNIVYKWNKYLYSRRLWEMKLFFS